MRPCYKPMTIISSNHMTAHRLLLEKGRIPAPTTWSPAARAALAMLVPKPLLAPVTNQTLLIFNFFMVADSSGDAITRAGLVVHTVRNTTNNNTPVVWYVGRICFPTVETDILIDTDHGPATISVREDQAGLAPPAFVDVRVGR